jgi:hypothetical protein
LELSGGADIYTTPKRLILTERAMSDFSWLCRLVVRAGLASSLLCAGSIAIGQTLRPCLGPAEPPGQFALLDPNVMLAGPISNALPPVLAMAQPGAVVPAGYVASPAAQPMTTIGPTPPAQPMIGTAAAVAPPGVMQPNVVQPSVMQPPSVAIAAAAPVQQMACAPPPPMWYLDVEPLFMWRDNNFPWFVANDFDMGAGPKVLLRLGGDPDFALEAEYFSILGMQASSEARLNLQTVAFSFQSAYDSSLHNVEINFARHWSALSILAGFRYLLLSETYHWSIANATQTPFPSDADTDTNNNLLGGQLGLRWRKDGQRMFFEATGKAGVFGNAANGKHSITVEGSTFESKTAHDTPVSFVGDLGFATGLHLSDVWTLRADYNLLWASGLAMAPNQMMSTNQLFLGSGFVPLDTEGRLFMHGIGVGLEAVW